MASEKKESGKKGMPSASFAQGSGHSPVSGALAPFASHSASKTLFLVLALIFLANLSFAANLTCSVKASCDGGETDVLHMSDLNNGHAEFANQSEYSYKICCKDADAEVTIGTGSGTSFLHLSDATNAQVEQINESNYIGSAMMSSSDPDYAISCGYEIGSCESYNACLASISEPTDAQIGDCSAYSRKVCCSIQPNPITGCMAINASGTYTQIQNINGAPNNASPLRNYTCVRIVSSDVEYDCNGYTITGSDHSPTNITSGIIIGCGVDNIKVRNCPSITNYSYGIDICNSTHVKISNTMTSNNSIDGIYVDPSSFINISYSVSDSNGNHGISFIKTDFSTIFETSVYGNIADGVYIENSDSPYLENVNMQTNFRGLTVVNVTNFISEGLSVSSNELGASFIGTDITLSGGTLDSLDLDGTARTMSVNLDGVAFSSEPGTYSVLSLTDYAVEEEYAISATGLPASPPSGYSQVPSYGFVDITPSIGSPVIDEVRWGSLSHEFIDYIDIFEYHIGSWYRMNAYKGVDFLSLTNLSSFSGWGPLINYSISDYNYTYRGIGRANVTAGPQVRWSGMNASNATTEGGNVTELGINMTAITDRWAAFYGNVTGSLALKEAGYPAYSVYEWSWNASDDGGFVCVSEDPTYNFFTIEGATPSEIDTSWGFDSYSDNAINTFKNGSCVINLAMSGATATERAKTGETNPSDPFYTCPLKSPISTPIAPGDQLKFAFCAPIMGPSGCNWKNESINFEMIVPIEAGPGAETYYFFAQLY